MLLFCSVPDVLIASPISTAFRHQLQEAGYTLHEFIPPFEEKKYSGYTGIITSNKLRLNAETLVFFPDLKWVGRMGSGMEIIDTAYCRQHAIRCFSSPGGIANSVAEHACGMLLGLLHRIPSSHREVEGGRWLREANRGEELKGRKIGIIGYGHTGRAFVSKLKAFGPEIFVFDKYHRPEEEEGIRVCDLALIQRHCDIISFHVPLNEETNEYYSDEFAQQMQRPHILVNTSRGEMAKTETILRALQSGKLQGACLDVLNEENQIDQVLQEKDHPLFALFQYPVLITPHIAGYSYDAIEAMSEELMQQLFPAKQVSSVPHYYEEEFDIAPHHIDQNGHVNNLEYLNWAHRISGKHWEHRTTETQRAEFIWVVAKNEIDYLRELKMGDRVRLKTWIENTHKARTFRQVEMYRVSDGALSAKARIDWYALDAKTRKPKRIPEEIAGLFQVLS